MAYRVACARLMAIGLVPCLPSFLMSVLLALSLPSPLSFLGLISPLLSYVSPVSLSSFSPLNDDLHSKVEIFGIIL